MSKNIEYVQSEVVGSEIVETATDSSKLGDLITEAWAQQYARSTGLPVAQPAVQVETEVVELKALLLALLRAVWKTTCRLFNGHSLGEVFSAAVISNKSVDDAYEWLLGRLMPSQVLPYPSTAPNLTANLSSIMNERDMSSGAVGQVTYGISFLRLWACAGSQTNITKLVDTTTGWTLAYNRGRSDNGIFDFILGSDYPFWPNVRELWIGAGTINNCIFHRLSVSYVNVHLYGAYTINNAVCVMGYGPNVPQTSDKFANSSLWIENIEDMSNITNGDGVPLSTTKNLYIPKLKNGNVRMGGSSSNNLQNTSTKYIFVGCKGDKTDTITLFCHTTANTTITDIEIGEGACQNLTILNIEGLTAANIYSHILMRLKQDEADCGDGVTITLGATNLAKLEDEQHPEYASLLAELRTTYKYTFA